jgi:membrane-anchored mycosin MYCP
MSRATTGVAVLALALGAGGLSAVVTVPAVAETVPTTGRCTVGKNQLVDNPQAIANLYQVGFPASWRFATGRGQVVAVVDSGVDARNAHLTDAVTKGRSFVGGAATEDAKGHGTAIAGIIGARQVKGSVLVGGAPNATIMPVRVHEVEPKTRAIAEGIRWAADHKADVINVSLSTGPSDPDLPALKSAVAHAVSRGAVVVAAAGNRSEAEPYTQVQYPAGFPGVVGVAAANASGDVDDFSVHGEHVDVSAPGSNVLVSFRNNGDCIVGLDQPFTSYATAYVSALVAQLRERFPADTAEQTVNRLESTADRPRRSARDDTQGWGLIQPNAALTSVSNAPPGTAAAVDQPSSNAGIDTTTAAQDPVEPARSRLLWWTLVMSCLLAMALIAYPLARRAGSAGSLKTPPAT